jgi:PE-PPE domain
MSNRKLRWLGLGLVTTAGAGVLGLSTMMNPAFAHADPTDPPEIIGLVIGGSGDPLPGPGYVGAANELYIDNPLHPNFPGTTYPDPYANGLYTPEQWYPIEGVHNEYINYPNDAAGFSDQSSSVGQGVTILENAINSNLTGGDIPQISTVFGYSQSSIIASQVMELLDPTNTPGGGSVPQDDLQFLLIGDPNNPNGGLLERFNGFETTTGTPVQDELNLPSLGVSFDGATPADSYPTDIYTLEYDGLADFPRYPLDFFSDLNAFLGFAEIHGTYLDGGVDGVGPTAEQIAGATLLPGSALDGATDSLTNYYMIDETAPLVSILPTQLQELLGPDLTYLINLGYGDGSLGYSDTPADVATPFGLAPDVSLSTVLSTLGTDTEQGIENLMNGTDPYSAAVDSASSSATSSATSLTDLWSALAADAANPAASLTDFVNDLSSAASTLYSLLLPTADIVNTLLTSAPAYEASLFSANLATGDLTDAIGLPIAADTALNTLAAGFEYDIISSGLSQIAADFSGLF